MVCIVLEIEKSTLLGVEVGGGGCIQETQKANFTAHYSCRVTDREGDWVTAGGGIQNSLSNQRATPGTEGIGEVWLVANAPKWSKQVSDQIRSDR